MVGPVPDADYHVALAYYPLDSDVDFWDSAAWADVGLSAQDSTLDAASTGSWASLFGASTLARVTTPTHAGAGALASTAVGTGGVLCFPNATTGATPGHVYTVSLWMRGATTAKPHAVGIQWQDAGGASLGLDTTSASVTSVVGTWTQMTHTATAPPGAARALFLWSMPGPNAASDVQYGDDFVISSAPDIWVGDPPLDDVSCNVRTVRIARGHDLPLDRFRPGVCTFTLYDPDGKYSPWRTAADPEAYIEIRPGIEVRVWIDDGGTIRERFRGIVDSIGDAFPDPGDPHSHEVAFQAFDPLAVLAAFDGIELSPQGAGEYAGPRIGRVLANAGYTGPTVFDTGSTSLQATTLAKNALDEIGMVTDTDLGAFYADRDGTLVYRDAAALVADPRYQNVQATFGEVEPEICYQDLKLANNVEHVRNDVSISNVGGVAVRVADDASIARYRPRTYRRFDLIHETAGWSTQVATAHVDAFKNAAARIEGFTVDLVGLTAPQRAAVLDLDLLWRVQVRRRAEGFQVVADLQVQAIGEDVSPNSWTITLNTFSAATVFDVGRWNVDAWDSGLWGY